MSEEILKSYRGNCHCGLYRFELTVPEIKKVRECNCSLCVRKGYLWVSVGPDAFKVLQTGASKGYEFGNRAFSHQFCPTCGTGLLIQRKSDNKEIVAINVRTLLDVNPLTLEVAKYDGESSTPAYKQPTFDGNLPSTSSEPEADVHFGSCHCGAVKLAVATKSLSEVEVKEDNCSLCQRNANILIYPHQSKVSITGEEHTTEYRFGTRFAGHRFCKICGVQMYIKLYGPPKEMIDTWPEARKKIVESKLEMCPVRVRVLEGVEWDRLNVIRTDEGTEGYTLD